jgi:hypothetical protein
MSTIILNQYPVLNSEGKTGQDNGGHPASDRVSPRSVRGGRLHWNRWSPCRGTGGRLRVESVVGITWNPHLAPAGARAGVTSRQPTLRSSLRRWVVPYRRPHELCVAQHPPPSLKPLMFKALQRLRTGSCSCLGTAHNARYVKAPFNPGFDTEVGVCAAFRLKYWWLAPKHMRGTPDASEKSEGSYIEFYFLELETLLFSIRHSRSYIY